MLHSVEHSAIFEARPDAQKIGVGNDGEINLSELDSALRKAKKSGEDILVSVMLVNNETGRIQTIEKLLEICQFYDVAFHSDMVQALGKIPIKLNNISKDDNPNILFLFLIKLKLNNFIK